MRRFDELQETDATCGLCGARYAALKCDECPECGASGFDQLVYDREARLEALERQDDDTDLIF
jgi:hypothetical protein